MPTQSYFPNRPKLAAILFGAIVFFATSVWFLFVSNDSPPLAVRISFWLIAPVSFYASFYLSAKLVASKPSVVLNEHGLYDDASMFPAGLVNWSDIASVVVYSIGKQKMVGVLLNDDEKFLSRFGATRRFFYKFILSLGYPIVAIPESAISIKAENLAEAISQSAAKNQP